MNPKLVLRSFPPYLMLTLFALILALSLQAQTPATEPEELPNVITPNGDGINDQLELTNSETMELVLFNQAGGEVSHLKGSTIIWEAKDSRGVELPDGLYFYSFKAPGGKYKEGKGFIYVFRGTSPIDMAK